MAREIIIIGGVAGGAAAAARLRRLDEEARITIFERGAYISFANCGLPYYVGGEIKDRADLILQTPQRFKARFNIEVCLFSEVTAIDRTAQTVTVRNGQTDEVTVHDYDKLILAPGAAPLKPPIEGINAPGVFTLRNVPDTDIIKDFIARRNCKTAAVIGGGYIGVEMAENLRTAGLAVTLIEMQNQLIAPLDYDMACRIHRYIESKGVRLMLDAAAQSIRETDTGLTVTLEKGEVAADLIIMAIGVKPEGALAAAAGLAVTARGAIMVDDGMRTADPDIMAVGDAVETVDFVTGQKTVIPLAGPAAKQGRIAADNLCGGDSRYHGTQGSAILKVFEMTAAATGVNEKTAKRLGLNYDKSFTHSASHADYYPGAASMSIKTIFEKETGKILGAQIVGFDGCDKRCDVIATAIRFGATAYDLSRLELCYAPPYSSAKDPVNMAGFVIENLLAGRVKNFHWHDVPGLVNDEGVILLDIRTQREYGYGHIDGAVNIPVDELRGRLAELDKGKPIYVICQVGLRGYAACRILTQKGFECYNLSGGYRLYKSVLL